MSLPGWWPTSLLIYHYKWHKLKTSPSSFTMPTLTSHAGYFSFSETANPKHWLLTSLPVTELQYQRREELFQLPTEVKHKENFRLIKQCMYQSSLKWAKLTRGAVGWVSHNKPWPGKLGLYSQIWVHYPQLPSWPADQIHSIIRSKDKGKPIQCLDPLTLDFGHRTSHGSAFLKVFEIIS